MQEMNKKKIRCSVGSAQLALKPATWRRGKLLTRSGWPVSTFRNQYSLTLPQGSTDHTSVYTRLTCAGESSI